MLHHERVASSSFDGILSITEFLPEYLLRITGAVALLGCRGWVAHRLSVGLGATSDLEPGEMLKIVNARLVLNADSLLTTEEPAVNLSDRDRASPGGSSRS